MILIGSIHKLSPIHIFQILAIVCIYLWEKTDADGR